MPIFAVILTCTNLCNEITGKKFLKKNLDIKTMVKTMVKKSNVLGQNITGN